MKTAYLEIAAVLTILASGAVTGFCANSDRSQFDVILEKKPFGVAPAAPAVVVSNPVSPVTDEANKQLSTLKLTLIRHDDFLGKVCAIDDTKNPAWHAYLREGETQDGVAVKQIDLGRQAVFLSKDGAERWLYMNGEGGLPAALLFEAPVRRAGRHSRPVPNDRSGAGPSLPAKSSSVWRTMSVESQQMSDEELDGHFTNYQMYLIRSGGMNGPPLPMELTPEMDDQLVHEGVLPPQE